MPEAVCAATRATSFAWYDQEIEDLVVDILTRAAILNYVAYCVHVAARRLAGTTARTLDSSQYDF